MIDPKKHKVSVLLSEDEFERLHAFCLEHGFKKSTLINKLLANHLDEQQFFIQSSLFDRVTEEATAKIR